MKDLEVDVIFGMHVDAMMEIEKISYRARGIATSSSDFKCKPSHGAEPWLAIDPVLVASQIVTSLHTIVSRNINVTQNPAVISVGSIHGGNRDNIIPGEVIMLGTIRAQSDADKDLIFKRVREVATHTAKAAGATAEVALPYTKSLPVTYNDPQLTMSMMPAMEKAAGKDHVLVIPPATFGDDFAYYSQLVPGLYFHIGGRSKGKAIADTAPHHSSNFEIDDAGFKTGLLAYCHMILTIWSFKVKSNTINKMYIKYIMNIFCIIRHYFAKVIYCFLLLTLCALSVNTYGQSDSLEKGYKEDFETFKKALEQTHPALYRFTPKETSDAIMDSLQNEINNQITEVQFFRILSKAMSLIREGHSYIIPSEEIMDKLIATKRFLFEVYIVENHLLITQSASPVNEKKGAFKGGRIANSINIDWTEAILHYHGDKKFKSLEELAAIYEKLGVAKDDSIIVYCHSGVRSVHTTFVLTQLLGYSNVRNYDGSWTEWSYFDELDYERDSATVMNN